MPGFHEAALINVHKQCSTLSGKGHNDCVEVDLDDRPCSARASGPPSACGTAPPSSETCNFDEPCRGVADEGPDDVLFCPGCWVLLVISHGRKKHKAACHAWAAVISPASLTPRGLIQFQTSIEIARRDGGRSLIPAVAGEGLKKEHVAALARFTGGRQQKIINDPPCPVPVVTYLAVDATGSCEYGPPRGPYEVDAVEQLVTAGALYSVHNVSNKLNGLLVTSFPG